MGDYDESYDDPSYNEYDDGAGEYDHEHHEQNEP